MAVSEAKTSTALVLLMEGDITKASDAGRKPAKLEKANLLFWQRFKQDCEAQLVKRRYIFLCLHRMMHVLW